MAFNSEIKEDFGKGIGTLEIIYTFDDAPQKWEDLPITNTVLGSRNLFFTYVTAGLSFEEKQKLRRISCCIYHAEKLPILKSKNLWYTKCVGKFYLNDIEKLMPKLNGLHSLCEQL